MTTLKYLDQIKEEESQSVVDNLLRKGWVIFNKASPPEFDELTEHLSYDKGFNTYSIIPLTEEEISIRNNIDSQQAIFDKIENGYKTEDGFILPLRDNDRALLSQMLLLVKEALDLGLISNDTPQTIVDKDGNEQTLSALRFRQIMVGYGMYYKGLWDQMD